MNLECKHTNSDKDRQNMALNSQSKFGLSIPVLIFTLLFLPFMGYVMHELRFHRNVEPPPPDFGSGRMFDHIATRYDMINRVLALRMDVGWRKHMIRLLSERLPAGDVHLLDVATGTADVAMQLAAEIPSATIVGVDPSNNMLQVGREKIALQGLSGRIELLNGDARHLSNWEANVFDGATMAFGIRNVPERDLALCEIHRLLRPKGVIAILEFSEPDNSHGVMGKLARLFIRHVVPVVGGLLSGAPKEYAHLQNSIKDFPSPKEFRMLMQNLPCGGFEMLPVIHMNFGSVQLYLGTAIKPVSEVMEQIQ